VSLASKPGQITENQKPLLFQEGLFYLPHNSAAPTLVDSIFVRPIAFDRRHPFIDRVFIHKYESVMNNLNIRPTTEKDLEAILKIYNEVVLTSTATFEEVPRLLSELVSDFENKKKLGFPWIVAEVESQVVGYGTYGKFRNASGYNPTVEHSLHIHSDFRNRGIGSKILKQLIVLAQEQGRHAMIAGIDASNTGSIRLHERFGFKEVSRLPQVAKKFSRWLDLIFMQLIIG
jgi:phosphinothricin acetyltransferase